MKPLTRMFQCSVIWLALVCQCTASPKPARYEIAHMYSSVNFSIMKFFFQEDGSFRDYSGDFYYDPDHPERSQVHMTVQAASIDTRIDTRDRVLRTQDFFDVEHYPTLTFNSVSVAAKPGEMLEVTGDLTIHGVTRRITAPVRFLGEHSLPGWGDFVGFDAVFTIDRTVFGVNGARWSGGRLILSNEVKVHLAIGGVKEGSR